MFGVSDSFTKFTGSIGKGLSAATMDREYQDRRRMNMARNRPKHAFVGVTQGAASFANSVASGFSGMVVSKKMMYTYLHLFYSIYLLDTTYGRCYQRWCRRFL